jgi:RecJ-like exonuclease
MVCEVCHGAHLIPVAGLMQPCPECGGLGTIHCCDGLQAQPEPESSSATLQTCNGELPDPTPQ